MFLLLGGLFAINFDDVPAGVGSVKRERIAIWCIIVLVFLLSIKIPTAHREIWGNAATLMFHLPTCKKCEEIKLPDLVLFWSHEEALKAGFFPCKFCFPSLTTEKGTGKR